MSNIVDFRRAFDRQECFRSKFAFELAVRLDVYRLFIPIRSARAVMTCPIRDLPKSERIDFTGPRWHRTLLYNVLATSVASKVWRGSRNIYEVDNSKNDRIYLLPLFDVITGP